MDIKHISFDQKIYGFRFTGKAEYEPEGKASLVDPAWEPIVTVYELFIDDFTKDVVDIIDPKIIQIIERNITEGEE